MILLWFLFISPLSPFQERARNGICTDFGTDLKRIWSEGTSDLEGNEILLVEKLSFPTEKHNANSCNGI